jgi:hypothetical protein
MNNSSKLVSLQNKLTVYKAILKPTWTYGVELCVSGKPPNIERVLRTILNAPPIVPPTMTLISLQSLRSSKPNSTAPSPPSLILYSSPFPLPTALIHHVDCDGSGQGISCEWLVKWRPKPKSVTSEWLLLTRLDMSLYKYFKLITVRFMV